MESVSMKKTHGVAKVLGCGIGFCGAMVFAFVKGPRISILKWAIDYHKGDKILGSSPPMVRSTNSHGQWIKGSLVMLLANMIWSSWLIMLVITFSTFKYTQNKYSIYACFIMKLSEYFFTFKSKSDEQFNFMKIKIKILKSNTI